MQLVFTSLLPGYVFATYDDAIQNVATRHATLPNLEVVTLPDDTRLQLDDQGRWLDPRGT